MNSLEMDALAKELFQPYLIRSHKINFLLEELSNYHRAEDKLIDNVKDLFPPEYLDDLIGDLDSYYKQISNPHVS